MRSVLITEFGGPEVLQVREGAVPIPETGQVLVRISAAGVNFIDIYQRQGGSNYGITLPFTPGMEGAGVIEALGDGVSEYAIGDRVAWPFALGSYSEYIAVDAGKVVKIPQSLDLPVAAGAMLQALTAHYLTCSTYPIKSGDIALVHAAAGGTGALVCQMVRERGGTVIATTSSDEKVALIREFGVDHIIRYDQKDFASEVREITSGRGVDVVYDGVGAATFDKSLTCLRKRGMMVIYGAASGPVPPFELQRLNASGSLFITRPTLAHYVATRDELLQRSNDVFALISSGALRIRIDSSYPLVDAPAAHQRLASGKSAGKLILTC